MHLCDFIVKSSTNPMILIECMQCIETGHVFFQGFACSLAIIITCVVSVFAFGFQVCKGFIYQIHPCAIFNSTSGIVRYIIRAETWNLKTCTLYLFKSERPFSFKNLLGTLES